MTEPPVGGWPFLRATAPRHLILPASASVPLVAGTIAVSQSSGLLVARYRLA